MQPFDGDFALDADGVVAQQRRKGWLAPRQHGEPVANRLAQVTGGDAVVAGVVKPAGAMQQGGQRGFADAGGAHQGDAGYRGHFFFRLH